ncbi:DUF2768 family protein [Bacillaceae bacterium W0354]
MSDPMMRMYISFIGMFLLILAAGLILLARYKLSGIFKVIVTIIAYACLVIGGLIIFPIVLGGPTA